MSGKEVETALGTTGERLLGRLTSVLTRQLPRILVEVQTALRADFPDYADFLRGEFDDVVSAASSFVARLVEQADSAPGPAASELGAVERALFEQLGRQHQQDGQNVDALLAAYRVGAAVAWRHILADAQRPRVPAPRLAAMAAALFTAVDQLSAASLRGYLNAETESARDRERLAEQLAELLLSEEADSSAVAALATRVGWPVPNRAAVVVVSAVPPSRVSDGPGAARDQMVTSGDRAGLGGAAVAEVLAGLPGCLRVRRTGLVAAVVPDPDGPGRRRWLTSVLRGSGAVVGESVPLNRLPASLALAELALHLRQVGLLRTENESARPLFVAEHVASIIVHQDEALLDALRQQALAPLSGLAEPARERLTATLRSWLLQMGNRQAMARELHVHPQTVRYRVAQLRDLFGTQLDDPAQRAKLVLVLL